MEADAVDLTRAEQAAGDSVACQQVCVGPRELQPVAEDGTGLVRRARGRPVFVFHVKRQPGGFT